MEAVSENIDDLFDNACSVADVDHWIAERLMYAKSLKAKTLMKDPHVNVSNTGFQNNVNPVNCEPVDFDTGLMQDSVCTVIEYVEGKVDNYYTETPVTFDSKEEEDIDFHRIDVCDMVE